MTKKIAGLIALLLVVYFISSPNQATVSKPIVERTWVTKDSKAYAQDVVLNWAQNQYRCLDKLWVKESNWRPNAYNKVKVMGKNAGGIPQILGLNPDMPAPLQIDRGFAYIMHR